VVQDKSKVDVHLPSYIPPRNLISFSEANYDGMQYDRRDFIIVCVRVTFNNQKIHHHFKSTAEQQVSFYVFDSSS
jgi:hypothetical protein